MPAGRSKNMVDGIDEGSSARTTVPVKHKQNVVLRVLAIPEVGILIPLIVMCVVISRMNSTFLTQGNIVNMLRSISFTGLIAIPMTYVFIAAGLDLSVGAVAGLSAVVAAMGMAHHLPVLLSVLLGLSTGLLAGAINGLVSVYLRIPSFIVTLGMMNVARGVIYVLTQGANISSLPDSFCSFGQGAVMGVPYSVVILIVVAIVGDFVLRRTTYGRRIYAVGGNEEVAALAGISVKRIRLSTYMLVAVASAAAGILSTARFGVASSSAGETWEMQAISAVIIGGTSMFGGVGTILGVMLGAITMGVLSTGMVLVDVSPFWQNVVLGVIMVLAVGLDQLRRSRLGL